MRMRGHKALFSYRDTWSLDATLSPIIAAGLRKFLEVIEDPKCVGGCPGVYLKDAPDYTEEQLQEACKRWHADIREMIWAFENTDTDAANIYTDAYMSTVEFVDCEPVTSNGVELRSSTVTSDEKLRRYYEWARVCLEARRARGMQLFVDQYKNLWW